MNTLRASKGITSSGKTFWLIPAIRKKERNGPGIVRFADSGDQALASSDGKESEGTVHRAGGTVTFLGIKRTQGKLVLSCPIYAVTALMSNGNCETYVFVGLNQVFVGSGEFI